MASLQKKRDLLMVTKPIQCILQPSLQKKRNSLTITKPFRAKRSPQALILAHPRERRRHVGRKVVHRW